MHSDQVAVNEVKSNMHSDRAFLNESSKQRHGVENTENLTNEFSLQNRAGRSIIRLTRDLLVSKTVGSDGRFPSIY